MPSHLCPHPTLPRKGGGTAKEKFDYYPIKMGGME